uniref:AAA+ ATPase domain-containing protein n=1 Tax=Kalanchoe fedtschenkoi TaxID=63787 RepID=A0A7N0U1E1_KALFE
QNLTDETGTSSQAAGSVESSGKIVGSLKRGDRVKYIGPTIRVEADNRLKLGKIPTSDGSTTAFTAIRQRSLSSGQQGEVYEVNGDRAAVIVDASEDKDEQNTDKSKNEAVKPSIYLIHVKDLELDPGAQAEDCYIAMKALCEVLQSQQPLIVYFPDSSQWLSRAVPKSNRADFVQKVQELFNQLSGPVVLICGQNKVETGSKEKEKFTMILPNLGRLAKLPLSLKRLTEGLKDTKKPEDAKISALFSNVFSINPPKEDDLLKTFNKQVEDDRIIVISRSNLNELHKVLEENELMCMDLLHVNTDGVILTKQKAEKVVGWAKNHYLATCLLPNIKGDRLYIPRESLEIALSRLRHQESLSKKPSQNLKNLAKDDYENNFVSAVVPADEIGVRFDDIGALEDVKKALNELVILPMRRPELFAHGNLLRPCKGILLFGPPGTGKTLLAKALATEAGANFISITGSTLTSKWFGDAEKLTKALFSFASKLAPVIIFVDEIDSLLGARGGAFEHEATRRMRNEFMAAWDGLRTKDSQRILILGATNRPFDLDDAVIRRLPRRIYVDLPDAKNREKILRIFLAKEKLESDFLYDKLAKETDGYSGSDLKNLCIAAAYRPVQELLESEKAGRSESALLRPLNLDDFIQAKSKVGPSVAYDATSMNELRKWNEQYGEGGSRRKSPFGF